MDAVLHTWYGGLILMLVCSYIIAKSCDVFETATDYLGSNLSEGVLGLLYAVFIFMRFRRLFKWRKFVLGKTIRCIYRILTPTRRHQRIFTKYCK